MATFGTRHAEPAAAHSEDVDLLLCNVEARLRVLLPVAAPNENDVLFDATARALLGRGKRVRPIMAMLACAHVGGSTGNALDFGCAVEMVHAASLVLDDLPCMDNAVLRRGAPTIHTTHGEDAAILAAVALLNQAYSVVLDDEAVRPLTRLAMPFASAGNVGRSLSQPFGSSCF